MSNATDGCERLAPRISINIFFPPVVLLIIIFTYHKNVYFLTILGLKERIWGAVSFD